MLHVDSAFSSSPSVAASSTPIIPKDDSPNTDSVTALFSTSSVKSRPQILLATARITVSSQAGRQIIGRALLDQGSEITFISEKFSKILKLRRIRMPISIAAVGGVNAGTCRHAADINISPYNRAYPVLKTTASILKFLTKYSPPPVSSNINWSYLNDLALADPDPLNDDPIDIIIGADLYNELIFDGVRKGTNK